MQDSGYIQGFTFFVTEHKPINTLFQLKSIENNFAQDVAYEPEAPMVPALGGLGNYMSMCVEIAVKLCFGA